PLRAGRRMTAPSTPSAPPTPPPPPTSITITVEGRQVTVPNGTSILEAAKAAGVLIPHYCYHPGLPVAGVCRMCLVDVEKAPKLAPSCATAAAEGQVVHVHSEKALEARQGVLEMLLINHPLDCPICVQAAECKFEGQDLTHAWAGNVIDLCPVGALLSKDSLNKARAWEMARTASVCPNCSQGCNMIVETRDNVVVRLRPRPNESVNKYFMCDHGRLNYRWMNRQDRVDVPMVRAGSTLASAEWEQATAAAASML